MFYCQSNQGWIHFRKWSTVIFPSEFVRFKTMIQPCIIKNMFILFFTFNCFCVVAKLNQLIDNPPDLWKEFFIEGFYNFDMLPVAIIDVNNNSLDFVLPSVVMNFTNSIYIFNETSNNPDIKASFLIFGKSSFSELHKVFLSMNKMFRENWSRTVFWFGYPISIQTEEFIFSQCLHYLISPVVITSPLKNSAMFKIVTTNNILNIKNNYLQFTFNKITIKRTVRKVIKNIEKLRSDFEGAVLRVKAHPKYIMLQQRGGILIGVDAFALFTMSKMLNFKVDLVMGIKNHFGNTFLNGSLVSSIVDLQTHKIDMNINRHVLISLPGVTMLPVLDLEEFCFILPYFRGYYAATSLILYLTPVTWLLVLLSVVLSALVWRLFNIISKTDDYPTLSLVQSFLTAKLFKINTTFHMIFLMSWCLYIFILVSIFRATVLKSIIKPFWVDDITNMEELLQSNLKIKNRIGIFQVARSNSTLEKLLNKSVVSHLIETDYEFHTSAYFTSKYFRNFLDVVLGDNHYYKIPDCLSDCYVSYLVASRSPYYDGLQSKVLQLKQHGFYLAWFRYFSFKSNILQEGEESFYFANSTKNVKRRPFTVKDLMFAFYIQIGGMILSSFVCYCEANWQRWNEGESGIPFRI